MYKLQNIENIPTITRRNNKMDELTSISGYKQNNKEES
jgi:hypothetical protein